MAVKWEAIPKLDRGKPNSKPKALIFAVRRSPSTLRLILNRAGCDLLSDSVVVLRNGSRLALRAANESDEPSMVRKITIAKRTGQGQFAFSGLGAAGQRFRLVPEGDLILLEPVE